MTFSDGTTSSTNTSVVNGMVALKTPASTDVTSVSPNAGNVNGTALSSVATTSACPQVRRSRGRGVRVARHTSANASAPKKHRPNATQTGGTPASTESLIKAKLAPQMADRSANFPTQVDCTGAQSRQRRG